MKKVFVILALLAVTGIASAEMVTNPQTLEGEALGIVGQGNPIPGWEGWGAGSGATTGGWSSTWWSPGGAANQQVTPSVIDAGGTQALMIDVNPNMNYWSYNLAFAHDNLISALPAGSNAAGQITLTFDVLFTSGQNSIVKIEQYALFGNHPNQGALQVDFWDPIDLAAGTHSFTVLLAPGANYVTPVLGTTGVGSYTIYDNISLTAVVPEPATLALLGLGGLLLRRKK